MDEERETILLVDDNPNNLKVLVHTLTPLNVKLLIANSGRSALTILKKSKPFLVLLDINMPEMNGYEVCKKIKSDSGLKEIAIIFLSALSEINDKLIGFESGGVDYITKPFHREELIARVKAQLTIHSLKKDKLQAIDKLRKERKRAYNMLDEARKKLEGPLLGESKAIKGLHEDIDRMSKNRFPLFIEAPVGCICEYIARTVHFRSERSSSPFLHINCSSLHKKSHTLFAHEEEGGVKKIEMVRGGTLYLSNIEHLDSEIQQSIMNEISQYFGMGIRLVCSSSQSLSRLRHKGEMLDGFLGLIENESFIVPSLNERGEDVIHMADFYAKSCASRQGKNILGISKKSQEILLSYTWPGNIEELINVVESQVMISKSDVLEIPVKALNKGQGVGAYSLIKKLDEGGMGEIWEAEHRVLKQKAAIKLNHANHFNLAEAEARFYREALAISKLSSSYTIRIYDFGTQKNGSFYYVMECLRGIDLSKLVKQDGALTYSRVLHVLKQVGLSLLEAHSCGLVHRDIKPGNIFLSRNDFEYDHVKLLDFGIAKDLVQTDNENWTGQKIIGTPMWMAPEVFSGELEPHSSADMYSLACVAYWLLSNKILFESTSPVGYYMAHVSQEAPPIRDYTGCTGIDSEFESLLLSCLSKNPDKRPSARQFLDILIPLQEKNLWSYEMAKQSWSMASVELLS